MYVGKVLTCSDIHPNSDHLHVTTVDLGRENPSNKLFVETPNVAAGQKVIVADPRFVCSMMVMMSLSSKNQKLRGVESYGYDMCRRRDRCRYRPCRYHSIAEEAKVGTAQPNIIIWRVIG